jgi:hypothetical protein
MAIDWMSALSTEYERVCREFPGERLMLLSDIDGTILDMRHMVLAVLQAYDRAHSTGFFERLLLKDITVHENQVAELLERLNIPVDDREGILDWYQEQRWTSDAIREMHRTFQSVLNVIRWFQLQPNTCVGLVTGRPETLREDTLHSLNQLGKPYRVTFTDDLLFMNPQGWEEGVAEAKVAGLAHFQEAGYRVFAFIDNEPANLKSLAAADLEKRVLLLHANTIFESKRMRVPRGTVRGKDYQLAKLIPNERVLPPRVQLVWHGINDEENLRQFFASQVRWGEVDLMLEPACHRVILRHDSFAMTPLTPDEVWMTLEDVLEKFERYGRAIKLDLKAGGMLLDQVLEQVAERKFSDEDLWFNANIERLMERGFQRIVAAHPGAIVQCPIDFLAPLIQAVPEKAHETLQMLAGWGINRFSISWKRPQLRALFDQMDRWGYEVNIYNVPDLETFLQAVLLLPRSVTSEFNFPQWDYYGRGSGKHGVRFEYQQVKRGRGRA